LFCIEFSQNALDSIVSDSFFVFFVSCQLAKAQSVLEEIAKRLLLPAIEEEFKARRRR